MTCGITALHDVLRRLDSTHMVAMELHDRMAHFWGREEVTSGVVAAFAHRRFANYTDDEHTIFTSSH